ncbi:hypothetical protein J9B83_08110 [Marinomonas sp. A79]|uniref:Uracil DNA glycosylase superfamily protein n=1 Tax=Marinomonas vulgaris TaxID=2823372 RepID=A0ABS5HD95_9GAMM|nr:hypothetical protein [Marinomonas vulgaris]MBR7888909.1 hypothetical protein [Marinomonas vulgaris]
MSRELLPQHAFQTHCLAQMGVVSWLSAQETSQVTGTVYLPSQPWPIDQASSSTASFSVSQATDGFRSVEPTPAPSSNVAPAEKAPLVHHLREQLNAGPEIIVEDLQPIEELAVDIVVEPEPNRPHSISRLDVRAYALSKTLLILSDVPPVFSQADDVEKLALNMGRALLKHSIDEWQASAFSWPGELKNPQFWHRTDWLFGAIEGHVSRLVKDFNTTPLLVLAGANITQLVDDLPDSSPLKHYPTARILSLAELHRIPELRKDAWHIMQTSLFS